MDGQGILIAGGYGVVGRRLAADLAPDYPGSRYPRRSQPGAGAGGRCRHRLWGARPLARHRRPSINRNALIHAAPWSAASISRTASCSGPRSRGLRYTDITPHLNRLGRGEAYDQLVAAARASGRGWCLARESYRASRMWRSARSPTGWAGLMKSRPRSCSNAGDISGAASFDYFLQELSMRYDAWIDGADRPTAAFTSPRTVSFPDPVGERQAFLFPFSDQALIRAPWECAPW